MTVTYSLDVASSSFFCLYKLLFRWKGSVWKSVWSELFIWCVCYGLLSVIYRVFLGPVQREVFEDLCVFFDTYSGFIPITFMLGFYVSAVFDRWGKIFDNIGWIDTPGLMITQYIRGSSERCRTMRRNALRYLVLTQALVFRDVSAGVRKRFPTMNHLVTAGLMTERELEHFESIISPHAKYWQPMHWLFSNIRMARQEGFIARDIIYTDLIEKIRQFRSNVLQLTIFDWVSVPLVYTQVVHLAVRSFFMIALFGRQYLNPTTRDPDTFGLKKTVDLYVPIMSILQFVFFVGWMKVAEVLLNPLGEDDDDFECNYILDRNLQVGLSMVDDAYNKCPILERDAFWEDVIPEPLYTMEAATRPYRPQIGSCVNMEGTDDDHFMLRHRARADSRASEIEETDVVQVQGLDRMKRNGSTASGESLAFSQSFLNQSRRLSAMIKKISKGGKKNSIITKKKESGGVDNAGMTTRSGSIDSMDRFGESFHNQTPSASFSLPPDAMSLNSRLDGRTTSEGEHSLAPEPNVTWTVDEMLHVIEEEEDEKKKTSDGDSFGSSRNSRMTKTDRPGDDERPETQRTRDIRERTRLEERRRNDSDLESTDGEQRSRDLENKLKERRRGKST